MIEFVWYGIIAALVSLDVTAIGQFMICRPIVVGPLFGYLLGDVKAGLWIGMIVELLWVNSIPMGASVPPDITAMTILATVWGIAAVPGSNESTILASRISNTGGGIISPC